MSRNKTLLGLRDVRLVGLYALIAAFQDSGVEPTTVQLATAAGYGTTSMVNKLLKKMEQAGAVKIIPRSSDDSTGERVDGIVPGWRRIPNRYELLEVEATAPVRVAGKRRRIPKNRRLEVLEACNNQCSSCGTTSGVHIDHIVPLSRGGSDAIENLQALCGPCNSSKGGR